MIQPHIGPRPLGDGLWQFTVWAPGPDRVELETGHGRHPMQRDTAGYWHAEISASPGETYGFVLDQETRRADPASHHQPDGVHAFGRLVDHGAFRWQTKRFIAAPLEDTVLYELHVGTFTAEGTFDAAIARLDFLAELGINAVEVMPVAQFPGTRNWGYDGVYPFAVQDSYGGPEGFKRFVDAAHARGLAVYLDVVYNHLGPEGNYLRDFGPYFTDRYQTPWGEAVNFDGPGSDAVRDFFIQNALFWQRDYRLDGLRLDATHAMFDTRPEHFLRSLSKACLEQARVLGRPFHLIAESNLNDPALVSAPELGGQGLDAVWNDDFHHSVHVILTGERDGYYADYDHPEEKLATLLQDGFAFQGEYSVFRGRNHGASSAHLPGSRFVHSQQNHDQTGNRRLGERLASLTDAAGCRLGAGLTLLAPQVPMLFMGEEWGERAPFLYFISHGDHDLVEAVRAGRREEFKEFEWDEEPPDPQDPETFTRCRLDWEQPAGQGRGLFALYRELLSLRRENACLRPGSGRTSVTGLHGNKLLLLIRSGSSGRAAALFNLDGSAVRADVPALVPEGSWRLALDSENERFGAAAPAAPDTPQPYAMPGRSFALYLDKGTPA